MSKPHFEQTCANFRAVSDWGGRAFAGDEKLLNCFGGCRIYSSCIALSLSGELFVHHWDATSSIGRKYVLTNALKKVAK